MKISAIPGINYPETLLSAFVIDEVRALDPITVILVAYGQGKGKIILECYGTTWSTYWGGMGDRDVIGFIDICGSDYISGRLEKPKSTRADKQYLSRIIEALKDACATICSSREVELPLAVGETVSIGENGAPLKIVDIDEKGDITIEDRHGQLGVTTASEITRKKKTLEQLLIDENSRKSSISAFIDKE
jgi:hypothetical protein